MLAVIYIHTYIHTSYMYTVTQWLKYNGTQGNAVPPFPIYASKSFPTPDCYNAIGKGTRPLSWAQN